MITIAISLYFVKVYTAELYCSITTPAAYKTDGLVAKPQSAPAHRAGMVGIPRHEDVNNMLVSKVMVLSLHQLNMLWGTGLEN